MELTNAVSKDMERIYLMLHQLQIRKTNWLLKANILIY